MRSSGGIAPLVRPDRLRPALRVGQQHTDDALAVGRLPTHHQPRATVACVAAGRAQRLRDLHVVDLRQRDLDGKDAYRAFIQRELLDPMGIPAGEVAPGFDGAGNLIGGGFQFDSTK